MKKILVFISFLLSFSAWAEVRLPAIINNNMVLQRQSEVAIWGWSSPGEKVAISTSWDMKSYETVGNDNATWKVMIQTPPAGGSYSITIAGENKIVLNNVLIGEVWICTGQSNMEWNADLGIKDAKAELPTAKNDNIRFFKMAKYGAEYPQSDCLGTWKVCDSVSLRKFSAVGYFFGKKLQQTLNIPIGLIDLAWGGSFIETWMPDVIVNAYPDTKHSAQTMPPSNWWPTKAGYIYNGMVYPIINYAIGGAIWYQGESNRHYPKAYSQLMHMMVDSWRNIWQKDFPFYYVQIAPYTYGDKSLETPLLREQQTQAMNIPKSGMIVTTDLVDDLKNIHPAYKKEVGNRLANWALTDTYNQKGLTYKSPQYHSMQVAGDKVTLSFDNAPNGLMAKADELTEFEVAGADKIFTKATAKIVGNTVEVKADNVKNPVAVRFAFRATPEPNLFSKEGLPVIPFRTDDWK